MKANDFMADWNKTHTSSPSFQDAIEWARKTTIEKACKWLERANSALPPCYKMFEVNIENFRKAMEK